ncbi:MAG: ABC transporter permease [Negativicutes bacterium]|nr:ABC transporter permease [Negativicutes bacterium]
MSPEILALLAESLLETIYMVAISALIATLLGIPLGVILITTGKGHILENIPLNRTLGSIVNACRSTPFIILMVAIIPFTRMIAGTSIGTNAAIVPLSIAAIPFVGRIVETALREVDYGLIEAAQAMGASPREIITKVLIPEAMPGVAAGLTITVINLIGHSAMAGAIGGGGLGDLAIRYGYQRFRADIMLATVLILIALVQIVQSCGDHIAKRLNKKQIGGSSHA